MVQPIKPILFDFKSDRRRSADLTECKLCIAIVNGIESMTHAACENGHSLCDYIAHVWVKILLSKATV
ncbi:hypothetical protein CA13_67990 [Planctomycetes bacterium CA13]|uniref:Uncharacterized protein n=1 Tax=Novipirellula herctigrandis TaxID=2527986 RepID=A0A5C5YN42_9BACT|nr:hypothetical protein CA13_67990 [Planctomycetes bacterium CA13]